MLLLLLGGGGTAAFLLLRGGAPPPSVTCEDGKCPAFDPSKGAALTVRSSSRFLSRIHMVVPPGAVTQPVAIQMDEPREPLDLTIAMQHHAVAIGRTVRMGPDGQKFLRLPLVSLPFDTKALEGAPGTARVRVAVAQATDKPVEWVEPESVDKDKGVVSFRMPHFSEATVALSDESQGDKPIVSPAQTESPLPEACTPDMMSTLRAAKCAASDCETTWDSSEFWSDAGMGDFLHLNPVYRATRLGSYLYMEDGAALPGLFAGNHPIKPIRTNHEVDLYNKMKDYIEHHPNQPLSQDDIMKMALDATRKEDGGKCKMNMMTAMLTALNVVRLLARPEQWSGHIMNGYGELCEGEALNECNAHDPGGAYGHNVDDPAFPILMDLVGRGPSGASTLPDILKRQNRLQSKGGKNVDLGWMGRLFGDLGGIAEPPGLKTPCPNPKDKTCLESHSAGCRYYYWTGAIARAGLGSRLTNFGFGTETDVKTASGQFERGQYEVNCARQGSAHAQCLKEAIKGEIPVNCDPKAPPPSVKPEPAPTKPTPKPAPAPPPPPKPAPPKQGHY